MRLTARHLNRASLARQMLLRREPLSVVEGVRRAVALQAQEAPSPYIALWSRLADFDPTELDRAFADHRVVKATLMRVTLHAVHADDYPIFHEAMQPTLRAARLNDTRFRRTGLTPDDVDALLPEVVDFAGRPRSNTEAEAWLDKRLGETPKPGVWWAFRQLGPFVHHPTGGPWSFGPRPAYVAAREQRRSGDPARSLVSLVRRYLEGLGPASVADVAQFALINRPLVRAALEAMRDELEEVDGPNGERLFDVSDGLRPGDGEPAPPRLLPMWDSLLLAYADRSRVIPADYRKAIARSNGDVLPTLLVDGYVAGVWRAVDDGIEATAFHRLTDEAWAGLDDEARALRAFLADRDPVVYKRYARWWTKLPDGEVRVIGR